MREPEPEVIRHLPDGAATLEEIRARLLGSWEYRALVRPSVDTIRNAFELYRLRAPSSQEVRDHLWKFREICGSDKKTRQRLEDGTAVHYMGIRPLQVEMDVTNLCNLRCTMCFFGDPRYAAQMRNELDLHSFSRIAEQVFPGTRRLSFSLAAEPLMHRDFLTFVAESLKYSVPCLYMSTNATLLDKALCEKLVELGFHAINVSLDAACKETFERLRPGARFESVLANVKTLNRIKAHHGSAVPRLSLSLVMMRSNIREVPRFLHLAHRLKAEGVHLMHMVPYSIVDTERESMQHDPATCNRILGEARLLASRLGLRLMEPGDFPENGLVEVDAEDTAPTMQNRKAWERFGLNLTKEDFDRGCCPFPWHFVGILPNRWIVPCGWWYDSSPVGYAADESFEKVWKGPAYQGVRDGLLRHQPHECCRLCPASGMGGVKRPEAFKVRRLY